MSHVIEISEEAYQRLERLADKQSQSPAEVVESLITHADATSHEHHYYDLDDWFRHLGMTDEEIAKADAELAAEEASDADAR